MKNLLILAFITCFAICFPSKISQNEALSCEFCHYFTNKTAEFLKNPYFFSIFKTIAMPLCKIGFDESFCNLAADNIVKSWINNFIDRILYSPIFCSKFGFCSNPHISIDSDQKYISRILSDKPPIIRPPLSQNPHLVKFVVLTDLHIDYKYQENTESNCKFIICCRNNADSNFAKIDGKAGKHGTVANCDLPPITVKSFIDFATNNTEFYADFFLWLGDNPPHDNWIVNETDHIQGTIDVSRQFKEKYDGIGKMYPIFGNHEGLPPDQFDIHNTAKYKWILNNITDIWKSWLTQESYETMRKIGYFSQRHPNSKLRIIGLFALEYDNVNPYLWKNSTDPWNILGWLENELRKSEQNNESVFLLSHFSLNAISMNKHFGIRYRALIDRFTNIIKGIFSGHTHEDSFEIIKSFTPNEISGIIHINPSLTTFPYLNPSFRVYEMDSETYEILDFVQYRLYLNKTNESAVWEKAYRFTEFYEVRNLRFDNFNNIAQKIQNNNEFYTKIMNIYWAEGPRGNEFREKYGENGRKYILCKLISSGLDDLNECLQGNYLSLWDYYEHKIRPEYTVSNWQNLIYE